MNHSRVGPVPPQLEMEKASSVKIAESSALGS